MTVGYDYIATKDVGFDNIIQYDNGIKIPFDEEKFRVATKGSVLMCIEGGSAGRKIGLLDRDVCFGNKLCSFASYLTSARFLYYYLQSPTFISLFEDNLTGIIGGVGVNKLRGTIMPLPPLAEQERMVAKIEELLQLVDKYKNAWSKLEDLNERFPEDLKKSILQDAIQGKLVEQRPEEGTAEELYQQIQAQKQNLTNEGKVKKRKPLPEITEDEIPFDIPENWKWVRIASIALLNPKNNIDDELGVSFIPMALIQDGFGNTHSFETRKWKDVKRGYTHFATGDIAVAKITPCFQNRKSVIFHDLENGYGAGTTELSIIRVINCTIFPKYLLWFFKTAHFISNGVRSFTGTAGQQRIHKDFLANCLVPLPPLAEQKRIVEKIEELLPLCEQLATKPEK